MVILKIGNLLEADEEYIAHQTNCVSNTWAGLAKYIFEKYPYSNTYKDRVIHNELGTISIHGEDEERKVINMYAQYYPGPPLDPNDITKLRLKQHYSSIIVADSEIDRQKAFHQCLLKIAKISNLKSIAFPYRIGSGLARGDWKYYNGTISNFATFVHEKYGTQVSIYQRKEDI